MRTIDKRGQVSRRGFLKRSSATVFGTVAFTTGAGVLLDPKGAWAITLKSLKPETMATLIQMARDTYPHDRLTDATYAKAVAGYDDQAAADPKVKAMVEQGCASLDTHAQAMYKTNYVAVGWEEQRTAILRNVETTPFFHTIRAGLVTSLYNQEGIWQKFGYEGASADKGGYIHRGFNDIDWLGNTQADTSTTTPGAKS
jgi:hypothetical protein